MGCGVEDSHRHETVDARLNALLWMQTSVEYEMACVQSYGLARIRLDEALGDNTWTAALEQTGSFRTLPPAVILDVDETVLDNSGFDARLVEAGRSYDAKMWDEWVTEAQAPALPGARRFIREADSLGVDVFFITNRGYQDESATARNLAAETGIDIDSSRVLCKGERPNWGSDKMGRRAHVAESHRILLLIGDDYNDFMYTGASTPGERKNMAKEYMEYWGDKWIIIPNPVYGTWEEAILGYHGGLSREEELAAKNAALEPMTIPSE
jgi:5'-nucleotidase (lipoprotein e(P4) family)